MMPIMSEAANILVERLMEKAKESNGVDIYRYCCLTYILFKCIISFHFSLTAVPHDTVSLTQCEPGAAAV